MPPKRISIRRSLLRNLVLLIFVTSGAILAVTVTAGRNVVEDLSQTLIDKAAAHTEKELSHFFGSIREQVLIGRRWASEGLLDPEDPSALNSLFVPVLEQNPQISSMMVSNSEGTEYLLLRDALKPDEWMNRVARVTDGKGEAYKRHWNARTGAFREETVPFDYDTRKRLWYQGALATQPGVAGEQIHWTEPVVFYLTRDPGITAGTHYELPDGRVQVVAYDLLLLDIARLTSKRVRPSENGTAFVLVEDKDGGALRVVGLPRDPRYIDDATLKSELFGDSEAAPDSSAQLPVASDFEAGPLRAAVAAWTADGRPAGSTFRFESTGGHWWAEMRPFDVGDNRFWIGSAVPEKDFLGEVNRQRDIVIGIALVALIAAIIMAVVLARGYGRPLEQLAKTSHRIRALDLDIDADVESPLREVNDLARSQQELITAMQSFARYVPLEVVRELVKRGDVAQIGGATASLTILFTDIRGFTTISENMSPQELAEHMAEYFDVMTAELARRGATVDKFVGDAIVAFWGAPRPLENHAAHAVRSTLACARTLAEKNAEWRGRGLPAMPTRFGLATGEVVVGNIGAASRLSYTVLGDTVNLAARLEGINKLYDTAVLASSFVVNAAGDGFVWRRIDRVAVKGKSEAVDVYELLGAEGEVPDETLQFARAYEAALTLFQDGEFARARSAVLELLSVWPHDRSLARLLAASDLYLAEPPPEPWDGATRLA